jgi:hypothetical protein
MKKMILLLLTFSSASIVFANEIQDELVAELRSMIKKCLNGDQDAEKLRGYIEKLREGGLDISIKVEDKQFSIEIRGESMEDYTKGLKVAKAFNLEPTLSLSFGDDENEDHQGD